MSHHDGVMTLKQVLFGISTFLPGIRQAYAKGTGGTNSARYCYSIWLRHLVMARNTGILSYVPKVVAEVGPGDSLGIGLASLISGAERYFALDVVEHANVQKNMEVFDCLMDLFRNRADIPGNDEFPEAKPNLDSFAFPRDILTEECLDQALKNDRIAKIRDFVENPYRQDTVVKYIVPWFDSGAIEEGSVDMIFSQAVLEHVDDLINAYEAMSLWLKPGGFMSHQIDFRSHGTAEKWNGHWTYSDPIWKLIRGKRPYLLNREPFSAHCRLSTAKGLEVVYGKRVRSESLISRKRLAERFQRMSDDDMTTSGAFIQAKKLHENLLFKSVLSRRE